MKGKGEKREREREGRLFSKFTSCPSTGWACLPLTDHEDEEDVRRLVRGSAAWGQGDAHSRESEKEGGHGGAHRGGSG